MAGADCKRMEYLRLRASFPENKNAILKVSGKDTSWWCQGNRQCFPSTAKNILRGQEVGSGDLCSKIWELFGV